MRAGVRCLTRKTFMSFVGKPAPDFTAPAFFPGDTAASDVKSLSLTDYRGKWVVFFWYPLDFTFICPTEILALSDRLDEFEELGAVVIGASTDSVYSHRAWVRTPRTDNGIEGTAYPIIADMTQQSQQITASSLMVKASRFAACSSSTQMALSSTPPSMR